MSPLPDPPPAQAPSPYFLCSERLGFRLWSAADLDLAWGLWGDPQVTRLIGGPFSRQQVQERLLREFATQQSHLLQYWPVFLVSTGEHLGCCGLRPYRPEHGIHEIGFHLRSSAWGQGYAAEAARAVVRHAFDTLGAAALFAGHNPENVASRRLLERLGFEYTHDEHYPPTGLDHPSYLLTRAAFHEASA